MAESEVVGRKNIGQSIFAVFAGAVVGGVLSLGTDMLLHRLGVTPPLGEPWPRRALLYATGYRLLYQLFAFYLTAVLAPRRPYFHAMCGGCIEFVLSAAATAAVWNKYPVFDLRLYSVAITLSALVCAHIAGDFVERRQAN